MIELTNVSLNYGETVVFDDFSIEFEENKINCVLGPSGCGKTTLLNLIAKKYGKVSYVFQEDRLIPQKTVRKNLEFVLQEIYKDKEELHGTVNNFLALAGLSETADMYPHHLSGGMKQRLSIIRAFSYPSEILLLDEPFKALDVTSRASLIKSFLDIHNTDSRTVVFVTHDIDEALLIGDEIFVFSNKPMTLSKKFTLESEKSDRKLYSDEIAAIKNEFYAETEKWSTAER